MCVAKYLPEQLQNFNTEEFDNVVARVANASAEQFCLFAFDNTDLAKMRRVYVRILIENSDRLKTDQKFVLLLRFRNFGEAALFDLVSLDRNFHREIAGGYLQLWGLPVENFHSGLSRVPYLIAGGHSRRDEELKLEGSSGDFGHYLLGLEVNALAQYLLSLTDIPTAKDLVEEGRSFINDLLGCMMEHHGDGFYERFIDFVRDRNAFFYGQNIGALHTMKVDDRVNRGDGDPIFLSVAELSGEGSLGTYIMVSGVAQKLAEEQA